MRRKFVEKGNAVFIDLFSGPGKCIIRGSQEEILSGGMRAIILDEAPFNECYYFDIQEINIDALRRRIAARSNCFVERGDSNILIKKLIEKLEQKPYRYHFAYIDPFGPDGLKFETLKELARLRRMDMMINFPIGPIKRNLSSWVKHVNTPLDNFLGTDKWRIKIKSVSQNKIYQILIDTFKDQLKVIGYPEEGLRLAASDGNIHSGLPTVPVKNTRDVDLYVLVLASKHPLAQKIWNSVIKLGPDGQRGIF